MPIDYGLRNDFTSKGSGYFGTLRRSDDNKSYSSEASIGVQIDGVEREIPLMVPTLERSELEYLLGGGKPTKKMVQKAVDYARKRLKEGKSPFAVEGEQIPYMQQSYAPWDYLKMFRGY